MDLSPIGRAALRAREGERLTAYKDSVGVWTIGVGVTTASGLITVTPGLKITAAQSDALFTKAARKYIDPVDKAVKVPLADHQADALISLCYNIGPGAFAKSSVVKRLNAGDFDGAAEAILLWKRPAEIISRRQGEYDQFRTPYSTALPKARRGDAGRVKVPAAVAAEAAQPAEPVIIPTKPRIPAGRWAEQALAVYEVKAIQQRYRDLGYFMVGKVDGIWGPATTATTIALQTQTGITADGHWGPQTKAALDDDANRYVVPAARANTTASDLRAQGSKIAIGGNRVTWSSVWSVLVTAFGVASYAAQNWDGSTGSLPWPLGMVLGFAPPWVAPVLIVALNLYNALAAQGIVKARVDAERTGLHNGEPEPTPSPSKGNVASPGPDWLMSLIRPARAA